jgi:uncharacterized protein (TIGR03083 family)
MTEAMTANTPAYSELVTAVRSEGQALLSAAGLGLDAAVTTCGEWDVAALVRHVATVWLRASTVVSGRATSQPQDRPSLPDGDPLEVGAQVLDDLVTALSDATAATPVWTWAENQPDTALFWARRMAHESSVHRFDAQMAHGMAQPVDAELAIDGLDELLDVVAPRIYVRDDVSGPEGTVSLDSSDNGTWCVALEQHGVRRLDVLSQPDVSVRGTSSALLLASYSRTPWTSLDVDGDRDLLERWTAALSF